MLPLGVGVIETRPNTLRRTMGVMSIVDTKLRRWTDNRMAGATDVRIIDMTPLTFRTAISDERIVTMTDEHVTFRYTDSATQQPAECTLTADEFMRRHLQHVPPPGRHRVRSSEWMIVATLEAHLERLKHLHAEDRATVLPGVWLPEGLAQKYFRAGETFEWQWLFPSRETAVDPATGTRRRHHVTDSAFQHAVRSAAIAAGITKRVTPHVLRHSFAIHLRENGTDIRKVQDLFGHESVEATQIYTHVMSEPGLGVRSPLDRG